MVETFAGHKRLCPHHHHSERQRESSIAWYKAGHERGFGQTGLYLRRCWESLLYEPWILDIDSTVKPLYRSQEGAAVGFNPHKPGRSSHVFHTYLIANLRLILDVGVQPGHQTAGKYARSGLFNLIESLREGASPVFVRGDRGGLSVQTSPDHQR